MVQLNLTAIARCISQGLMYPLRYILDLSRIFQWLLRSLIVPIEPGQESCTSTEIPAPPLPPPPPSPQQLPPLPPPVPPSLPSPDGVQHGLDKSNHQSGGTRLGRMFSSEIQQSRKAYQQFLHIKGWSQDVSSDFVFLSSYSSIQPVIQNGPICGMVALAMASELAGSTVATEEIFAEAVKRGYSKQGEMFSAPFLQELASHFLDCNVQCITLQSDRSVSSSGRERLIEHLLQRNLILIPYDADKNHGPCQKKGHKAHWALLTGFFLAIRVSDIPHELLSEMERDKDTPSLYNWPSDPTQELCEQTAALMEKITDNVFVYGHHGKSKHAGLWSVNELLLSNDNLVEAGPERDCGDYVLPEGGVEVGLRSQMVVIDNHGYV